MHAVVLIVVCQNVSINHGLNEEKANPGASIVRTTSTRYAATMFFTLDFICAFEIQHF